MSAQNSAKSSDINLPRTRRRGLRTLSTLLQIPLLSRPQTTFRLESANLVGNIPADVLYEIAGRLWTTDLLNLSLTSKHVRELITPVLYDTVVLKSSRACKTALTMLNERPDICQHVRKLAVRPNYYLAWPRTNEPLDENWVVDMIEKIAVYMPLLHTFDWDGLEMPRDCLWKTLRHHCPRLKTVYSNVGYEPLDPDSSLFDFQDLTSFSLTVRHGLEESDLFPIQEQLPERLWDMLSKHSPDLEEITLSSFSSSTRLFDIQQLCNGHWPKLHTLTLGSFGYKDDFTLSPPNDVALGAFLSRHTSLKYIRLAWNFKRWMSPHSIPMCLEPSALPELNTFIGVYQQLAELPNPESIETLDLTCEPLFDSRVQSVCPILRTLTSLTSLDLWLHIPDVESDHIQLFRSILTSCPKLTDFHFMCTTPFTIKPLRDLSVQLHLLPNLKTFSLTKGHKYRDESMLQTALHVIRHNPTLAQVNIRWAREKCLNHLKQEGSYDVTMDEQGKPAGLVVNERGLTLVGRSFTRRYTYNLKRDLERRERRVLSAAVEKGKMIGKKMKRGL